MNFAAAFVAENAHVVNSHSSDSRLQLKHGRIDMFKCCLQALTCSCWRLHEFFFYLQLCLGPRDVHVFTWWTRVSVRTSVYLPDFLWSHSSDPIRRTSSGLQWSLTRMTTQTSGDLMTESMTVTEYNQGKWGAANEKEVGFQGDDFFQTAARRLKLLYYIWKQQCRDEPH